MRTIRRIHLYLGCFFAPMLAFYAATGWYQTFHTNRNKSLGEQDDWISRLSSIHVDQIYPSKSAASYSPQSFRILVAVMCAAFLATLMLGIYLAFRTSRRRWPVIACLAAGLAVPIAILRLGQHR